MRSSSISKFFKETPFIRVWMKLCLFYFMRIDESNDIFVSCSSYQTFSCYNGLVGISVDDTSWILDVEI